MRIFWLSQKLRLGQAPIGVLDDQPLARRKQRGLVVLRPDDLDRLWLSKRLQSICWSGIVRATPGEP